MSRVFVLGNAMVDLSLPMPRLPLPGETVVADGLSRAPGGKGLNQAVVAARAGAEVFFRAAVGRDADAAFIAESLADEGFASLALLPCDASTDLSILMVAADSENSIVSLCRAADTITANEAAQFTQALREGDWLVLQGNLTLDATRAAAIGAHAAGGHVFFNPAPIRWPVADVLAQSDVIVVNRVEASLLSGQEDPVLAAQAFRTGGAAVVVVTLGEEGCLWLGGALQRLPAQRVHAIDSSGAGDSFCGVLVAALAAGAALETAIARAQAAAALTVTRRGAFAALPSRAELQGSGPLG
jgi:ribokinase